MSLNRRIRRRRTSDAVMPQLTSMMDMFTILLVFLLKNFSTHGQLISPSQDITLPVSAVQQAPETGLDVVVSRDWILVNGKPVARTQEAEKLEGFIIPSLRGELQKYAAEGRNIEEKYGKRFSGKVTIQGDKRLAYRALIKVMATCGQARFPNMRLVVYQKEE